MEYDGTYHAAILHTLLAALTEIKRDSCAQIHIHSSDEFVAVCVEKSLQIWKEKGYRKKDGSPIGNEIAWSAVSNALERILPEGKQAHGHPGHHSFYQWMMREMERKQ